MSVRLSVFFIGEESELSSTAFSLDIAGYEDGIHSTDICC